MKKLTIVLSFILLLCLIFAITAFAQDSEDAIEENVASQAKTFKKVPDAWNVGPQYLVDGNRATGTSATHGARYTEMWITFDRDIIFSKLVVVANSIGTFPTTGFSTGGEMSTNGFWYGVKLLDADGNVVTDLGNRVCGRDDNENGEIIYDLTKNLKPARSIYISMDTQWNNSLGLWELEAYEHKCKHDTITTTYMEPTCVENGNGIYSCICGDGIHDIIPALGYHPLDEENPKILYENGVLQKGEARNCCTLCDEYYEPYDIKPVFDFLGYSASFDKNSICVGFAVNENELAQYEQANSVSLKYGTIISTTKADAYIDKDGNILASSTLKQEAQDVDTLRFDIKLSTANWSKIADYELVMCAYVIEGESVYYLSSETETTAVPNTITYNQIINPQAEEAPIF